MPEASLERHIRSSLGYAVWSRGLCGVLLLTPADADAHAASDFSPHPGQPPATIELLEDNKEEQVWEILEASKKGCPVSPPTSTTVEAPPPPPPPQPCQANASCSTLDDGDDSRLPEPLESTRMDDSSVFGFRDLDLSSRLPDLSHPQLPDDSAETTENFDLSTTRSLTPIRVGGSRTCSICLQEVHVSRNFTNHVISRHWDGPLFRCRICGVGWKSRGTKELRAHLATRHKMNMVNKGVKGHYEFLRPHHADAIEALRLKCFDTIATKLMLPQNEGPTASDSSFFRKDGRVHYLKESAECVECEKPITTDHFNVHVAYNHLKKPVFACKLCPFTESYWTPQKTARHIRGFHGLADWRPHFVDHRDRYQPELDALVARLFPVRIKGSPADVADVRCRLCGLTILIRSTFMRSLLTLQIHAAGRHLDEPLHGCRACPAWGVRSFGSSFKHFARKHRGTPKERLHINRVPQTRPAIHALMSLCFGVQARD